MFGGGWWANQLQTLSQGPLLTFHKLIQELPGVHQDVRKDPEALSLKTDRIGNT